jgi:hypothetical protein
MPRRVLVALCGTVLLAASCVSPLNQGHALIGASVRGSIDARSPATPSSPRTGTSESWSFLFLFAGGDASLDAALRAGGITRIHCVEYESRVLLGGLTSSFRTIVHGE